MLQALGAVAIVNHLQALESVRGVWVCFFGERQGVRGFLPLLWCWYLRHPGSSVEERVVPSCRQGPEGCNPSVTAAGKKEQYK